MIQLHNNQSPFLFKSDLSFLPTFHQINTLSLSLYFIQGILIGLIYLFSKNLLIHSQ